MSERGPGEHRRTPTQEDETDFHTSSSAYSLHTQSAQRDSRDLERRRVIAERIAERTAEQAAALAGPAAEVTAAPVAQRRPRAIPLFSMLRARRA